MKKSNLVMTILVLAIALVSCTKSEIVEPPVPQGSGVAATDWMAIQLFDSYNDDGSFTLEGEHNLDGISALDLTGHQALAYVRMDNDREVSYKQLPAAVTINDVALELVHKIDVFSFFITVRNADFSDRQIDATLFEKTRFRVVLVPSADYATMDIDWSNYEEVAAALNLE
jgi:hypothetical protein